MDKIIYSKHSNERDEKFSIKTFIYENEKGVRRVEKRADTKAAKKHIEQICQSYSLLQEQYKNTNITMNRCMATENGIELEYLDCPSLESLLDEQIAAGNKEQVVELIESYFEQLFEVHKEEEFIMTDEFRTVFGEVSLSNKDTCGKFTNVDALFSNILILENASWCMLDYEWTFDFPIPVKYLIYRILFYYTHEHPARDCIREWVPMHRYGITESDIACYSEMEKNFQKYIQGTRVPIRDMFDAISPGIVRLDDMKYLGKEALRKQKVQIYQSNKENITEEDSYYQEIPESKCFFAKIMIPSDIRYFRVDPCSQSCLIKELRILLLGREIEYITNGEKIDEDSWYYDTEDPWILMKNLDEIAGSEICISFKIEFLDEKMISIIKGFQTTREQKKMLEAENKVLEKQKEVLEGHVNVLSENVEEKEKIIAQNQAEIAQKEDRISQLEAIKKEMENTKVWKLYSRYKAIGKKTGER